MSPAGQPDWLTFNGFLTTIAVIALAAAVHKAIQAWRTKTAAMDSVLTWSDCPCRTTLEDCGDAEHRRLAGYDASRWAS